MDIIVNRNIIASANMKPTITAGVQLVNGKPAIRQVDPRGRVLSDGTVVLFAQNAKGDEVIIKMNPDETREVSFLLAMLAWASAGAQPPCIEVKEAAVEPLIIGGAK